MTEASLGRPGSARGRAVPGAVDGYSPAVPVDHSAVPVAL
jgi:hypothetical protein